MIYCDSWMLFEFFECIFWSGLTCVVRSLFYRSINLT
nr:MAG TPA: hypothetical protein [Caudoviricetes sp.]